MTVDLVPNDDSFWEEYPSDDDVSVGDSDTDVEEEDFETDAVKALDKEIRDLEIKIEALAGKKTSASSRQAALDQFGQNLKGENPQSSELDKYLKMYSTHRDWFYEEHQKADEEIRDLNKDLAKKQKLRVKLHRDGAKKYHQALIKQDKHRERRRKLKAKEEEKKRRDREAKKEFWPRKCYRVTLYLEAAADLDALHSSRPDSIAEGSKKPAVSNTIAESNLVTLSISYITQAASWSPRYDLTLLTPSRSGKIVYRAEFFNKTSETWRDAKVTLSTSQTTFQGLNDAAPTMVSWHVGLNKNYAAKRGGFGSSSISAANSSINQVGKDGLWSQYELNAKNAQKPNANSQVQRQNLFGVSEEQKKLKR
jgi:hypothetical protein